MLSENEISRIIERQAQKIAELIADRDSWIEAHARLHRLYHESAQPRIGEEIHVNVSGGDVYTLPLQASGMDKPRFVVHLPRQQQAEPVGDELPQLPSPIREAWGSSNDPLFDVYGAEQMREYGRACQFISPYAVYWRRIQGLLREIDPKWGERGEFGIKPIEQVCMAISDLAAQSGQRAGVAEDSAKAIRFAGMVFKAHRNGGYPSDVDGDHLQRMALECGLIEEREVSESCGANCSCADVGEFPSICYFNTKAAKDALDAAAAPTQQPTNDQS